MPSAIAMIMPVSGLCELEARACRGSRKAAAARSEGIAATKGRGWATYRPRTSGTAHGTGPSEQGFHAVGDGWGFGDAERPGAFPGCYQCGRAGSARLHTMKANCGTCGTEINISPYRIRRSASGLVFCSPKCLDTNPIINEIKVRNQRTAVECDCPVCGRTFKRKPSELREVNYCSRTCGAKANMRLRPIPKGERRGVATEFTPGQRPSNWCPVGTVRERAHRGVVRAWVKVAEPNVWRLRAVVSWESLNGPLPAGHVVHHRNRDPLDDQPGNLEALTRAAHLAEHRAEIR
jgi:hypothetical protein